MSFWLLLLVLPLAPYPTLAYAAGREPLWLFLLLPAYFALPYPLFLAGGLLPHLPRFIASKASFPLAPYLAALSLPFLAYWLLASQVWSFPQAYAAWGRTAGLGVALSLGAALFLGRSLPPLFLALLLFFLWSGTTAGLKFWLMRRGGHHA